MTTYTVCVGYTVQRPLIPDERHSWVRIEGETAAAASLLAAQIVGTHCTMVTSTDIVAAEI
ncbi:hypothetical protein [Streptomyces sp.]|uniref:hypothetical protein n=1 Tax=Streptomyces sp. TaxID=1931 RepID=UPI002F91CF46